MASSTAVLSFINDSSGKNSEEDNVVLDRLEKCRKDNAADELIEKIKNDKSDSPWMDNLKTFVSGENVSWRNMGLVVSAVSILKQEAKNKEAKIQFTKGYAGKVKEKLLIQDVRVIKKKTEQVRDPYNYNTGYKTRDILTLQDENGHMLAFFTSRKINVEEGTTVVMKSATIKAHKQYNGIDQTVLTRARFEED